MVSIVVPVYNIEKYIEDCVRSITAQTYRNFELLLVVDGATDESGAICDRLAAQDDRIRVFHKENGGVSSARNLGITEARGDYLMFVDGDDWLEPDTLESLRTAIAEAGTDACYCTRYFHENEPRNNDICIRSGILTAEAAVKLHLKGQFTAFSCLSMSKLEKVRGCLFDTQLHMLEDWEFNFRQLACIDSLCLLEKALYHYRITPGSASRSALNERKASSLLIPDKVENHVREHGLPYAKEARYVRVYILYHMLVLLSSGAYNRDIAARIAKQARKALGYALRSADVPLKQKVYLLAASVSPRIFRWAYALKYWRKPHVH